MAPPNLIKVPAFAGGADFIPWLFAAEGLVADLPERLKSKAILSAIQAGPAQHILMLALPLQAFVSPWVDVRPHIVAAFTKAEATWERDLRFQVKLRWTPGDSIDTYIARFAAEVAHSPDGSRR